MDFLRYAPFLSLLRQQDLRVYVEIVRGIGTKEEYDALAAHLDRTEPSAWADEMPTDHLVATVERLDSAEYAAFLEELDEYEGDVVVEALALIRQREHELRLELLRRTSPAEYADQLRPIGEQEVADALSNGLIVNGLDHRGEPEPIRYDELVSGAFLRRPTPTAVIDAPVLARVLHRFAQGRGDAVANLQGLRLKQVLVRGTLVLNGLQCPFPLGFEGCWFPESLWADNASMPSLRFDTCDFSSLEGPGDHAGDVNLNGSQIQRDLDFFSCHGLGQLFLIDCTVGSLRPGQRCLDDTELAAGRPIRVNLDGSSFTEVVAPVDEDAPGLPFPMTRTMRIERLTLPLDDTEEHPPARIAQQVLDWLQRSRRATRSTHPWPSEPVVTQVAAALQRSGEPEVALEFSVLATDTRTRSEGLGGLLKRVFLKHTVRYFYDNIRALYWLLGVFALAWLVILVIALGWPGEFLQSPLANPSDVPKDWLHSTASRIAWSFLFATDLVVSPLSLGQAQVLWPRSAWLSLLFAAFKGVSLLLLSLYITGVSGLAQRRSNR